MALLTPLCFRRDRSRALSGQNQGYSLRGYASRLSTSARGSPCPRSSPQGLRHRRSWQRSARLSPGCSLLLHGLRVLGNRSSRTRRLVHNRDGSSGPALRMLGMSERCQAGARLSRECRALVPCRGAVVASRLVHYRGCPLFKAALAATPLPGSCLVPLAEAVMFFTAKSSMPTSPWFLVRSVVSLWVKSWRLLVASDRSAAIS